VIAPLVMITSEALTTVSEFLRQNPKGATDVERDAIRKLLPVARDMNIGFDNLRMLISELSTRLSDFGSGLISEAATGFPNFVIDIFLFVVALYYFLRDGESVAAWLMKILPFRRSETDELYSSIRDTIHGALLGTIVTAVVQGGLVLIAFMVLQVPGAFLFAIVAAILSFTPVIGTVPVTLGATIYLVLEGRYYAAGAMLVAALIVGSSDNIVRPWVTSAKGNLHPLLGLLSIFGGISVFGPFGIFLGPVTGAMAIWTLDTYGNLRRAQAERAEELKS
jgi:predicted PurR-regulated permease PerM